MTNSNPAADMIIDHASTDRRFGQDGQAILNVNLLLDSIASILDDSGDLDYSDTYKIAVFIGQMSAELRLLASWTELHVQSCPCRTGSGM